VWLIIVGSRFDDWVHWTPLLQLHWTPSVRRLSDEYLTNLRLIPSAPLISLLQSPVRLAPANELRVLLWAGAERKQNTHLNVSSVVICLSVDTVMRIYQTVVQQRSIPRCHGNVLGEALPSRWSYSGFQPSCHNILLNVTIIILLIFTHSCRYVG
jgi:hypothetical protein